MTIPSIADVRVAAAVSLPVLGDYRGDLNIARLADAHERLAAFAQAVLNAPSMTAERLVGIQQSARAAEGSCTTSCNTTLNVDPYCPACMATQDANAHRDELLAEVLRLRAELARVEATARAAVEFTGSLNPPSLGPMAPFVPADFTVAPPLTDQVSRSLRGTT